MKAGMLSSLIGMLLPPGAAKGGKASALPDGATDFAALLRGAAVEAPAAQPPSAGSVDPAPPQPRREDAAPAGLLPPDPPALSEGAPNAVQPRSPAPPLPMPAEAAEQPPALSPPQDNGPVAPLPMPAPPVAADGKARAASPTPVDDEVKAPERHETAEGPVTPPTQASQPPLPIAPPMAAVPSLPVSEAPVLLGAATQRSVRSPAPMGNRPASPDPQGAQATPTPAAQPASPVETVSQPTTASALGEATALLRLVTRDGAAPATRPRAEGRALPLPSAPAISQGMALPAAKAQPTPLSAEPAEPPRNRHDVASSAEAPAPIMPTPAAMPSAPASATAPLASAPADLAATLGQQVIDIGSSGQWIDGMAREIASLAAGEGRGSFRLAPEHLGPMRVDILPGDHGSEVRLTVETQAAEAALVKDRGQLRADAQLAAVRIADVTIERVASVADSALSHNQGQQQATGQQGSPQHGSGQAALAQQQQGANHGQGHSPRKFPDGDAVIHREAPSEPGAETLRRARYA